MRSSRSILAAFILLIAAGTPIGAQSVVQVGSPVTVVSPSYYRPAVTTLPSGDFVVVWGEYGLVGGSIVSGGTAGAAFPVSTTLAFNPTPDMAADSAGNFVVVWNDVNAYPNNLAAQRFASSGTPSGGEIVFGTGSFGLSNPRVDLNGSGQFVVTWSKYGNIYFQGFGPSPFGPFSIDAPSANLESPDVAVDPTGNFLVTWSSNYYGVEAQSFGPTGAQLAAAFNVSPYHGYPAADSTGAGTFVVVWNEDVFTGVKMARTPSAQGDVFFSLTNATGTTAGPTFVASATGYSYSFTTQARVAANGSHFVVTWLDGVGYFGGDPLKGQVFTNTGIAVGSTFTATSIATWNNVSINDNGTFTVAWNPGTVYGQQFQVCGPAVAPTLNTPANGSLLPEASPVSFSWSDTGATDYDLSYSVNAGTPIVVNVLTTSTSISLPPGAITWSVVSNYLNCPSSAASATGSFTVCPTASEPARVAPSDGTTFAAGSTVNFQWGAVANASGYDVYIKVDGGTASLLGSTVAPTVALSQAVPSGSIEWYVIANFSGGCPSSPVPVTKGTFTVCPTATAPSLTAPVAGATVSSPVTFSWGAVTGATSYDVYVGVGGSPTLAGNTASATFGPLALADGAGTWYVVANFGAGCATAQSATEAFTVSTCPTLSPPTLLSPPNGAVVAPPVTFSWSAVSGATGYELFVGVGTSPTLAGTTTATSLTVDLPEGTGDWYVVAKSSGSCPTAPSSTGTFTVDVPFICPTPSTPTLTAPEDGAEFELGELVSFEWTAAPNASRYEVWGSVDGAPAKFIGSTANTFLVRPIELGTTEWYVIASFGPGCETATTTKRTIKTKVVVPPPPPDCGLKDAPLASIVGEATTGETYTLIWDELDGAIKYHVQESSNESFIGGIISEQTVGVMQAKFSHPDLTTPTPFFYRVAGITECDDGDKQGPYSKVVRVVGLPKPMPSSTNPQVVTEFGNEDFVETFLFIPGFGEAGKTTSAATFSVSSNEPWLTVSPASGTLPPEGTTVKLLAAPKDLGLGANTATVTVTRDDGLGKTTSGSTTKGVPVAVSLVTPVTPIGKSAGPPENSLIIPAVANVTGINSKWFSDVKITNRSGQLINYQLNFSATDQSGTVDGKQTKVTIRPGQTVALDDVVRQWYGLGDLADGTNGALEIRPLNFTGKVGSEAAPMLATVASSRTFTRQENSLASYGQFIPAVPFSGFLKAGVENSLLMMQQVSQTASLRTNFGLVEGAGKDVNIMLTAYDREGTKLGEFPVSLKAGEHKQLNSLLALNNISVEDGRMTVQIVSGDGAVTSYASVVASGTGDPSLVPGINPANLSAKKYVLPGVADLRIGDANWRSDIRIFNPNQAPESVNVFFYPQGETTPLGPVEIQIQPGQISVLPGVVESLFGRQDLGGALHVVPISGQATSLVITGETYDVSELGKYGQFIPAVTEENAIGVGSPGLEVMQVEESAQFRTNLGLAEVTGQQATVQIQLTVPNSLIAPTRTVNLGGNEFQQLNGIVRSMAGGRDVYNGRLTVRVVGGTGKITAYGSTVDNQTRDATFSAGQ